MPFHSGSFLVAKPSLLDPNFRQSVVLIIQHDEEGAFGLVVNRPVPVEGLKYPVYAGGPCQTEGLFLLHSITDWSGSDIPIPEPIAPDIYMADATYLEEIKELDPEQLDQLRLFAGYARWGPGQLEEEICSGAWSFTPADGQTLFGVPADELWNHLKPPSIPKPSLN
ncbi:MAG: YqgE/AlgH family protein [Gemmataceae bacterium]